MGLPLSAFQLSIDNPNYIPPTWNGYYQLGCGNSHREIEYESNLGMIDEQRYKTNECFIRAAFVPWKRLMIGVDLYYDFDREYQLRFGPQSELSGSPDYNSSSSGFMDPDIFLAYEFRSKKDSWNQQIFFKMNPFDIEEQPKKIYRGGHDIFLEYRFSHKYEEDSLYGNVYSHYFGKKNYYQPGDRRPSVKEAYTEVGLDLGYLYRIGRKWSLQIEGQFALSSDYDVITPDLKKTADKGYLIGAKFGVNYFLNKTWALQATHYRASRVYNATNEDRTQEIDYEIEDKTFTFSLLYRWDSSEFIGGLLK